MPSTDRPSAGDAPDGDDVMLAALAESIVAESGADGVLLALHHPWHGAVPLFFSPPSQIRSPIQSSVLDMAQRLSGQGSGAPPAWHLVDGSKGGNGGAVGAMTAVLPDGGLSGTITITTLFGPLSAAAVERAGRAVERVAALARPFFLLWRSRRTVIAKLREMTVAVDHSNVGIIITDAGGLATFVNPAANRLLAESDGLRLCEGRLRACKLSDTMRLRTTIEHVAAAGAAADEMTAPVIALPRHQRRALLVAVVASEARAAETSVIVNIFDPEADLRPLIEPVCKLYGLSPVESRLACLIADGRCLTEAASAMRVREQSARSYLKQIFLKTNTNRQAELVRLLLRSSVQTTGAPTLV